MPFGKHTGHNLTDLPGDYLRWLVHQDWLPTKWPVLYAAAVAEYQRRMRQHTNAWSDTRGASPRGQDTPAPAAVLEIIDAGYKALAKRYHPDLGGSTQQMQLLNRAVEWLRNAVRGLRAVS